MLYISMWLLSCHVAILSSLQPRCIAVPRVLSATASRTSRCHRVVYARGTVGLSISTWWLSYCTATTVLSCLRLRRVILVPGVVCALRVSMAGDRGSGAPVRRVRNVINAITIFRKWSKAICGSRRRRVRAGRTIVPRRVALDRICDVLRIAGSARRPLR